MQPAYSHTAQPWRGHSASSAAAAASSSCSSSSSSATPPSSSTTRLRLLSRWADVTTTNHPETANAWLKTHILSSPPVRIGFDTESHPVQRQPNQLALLQFAVHSTNGDGIQVLLFSIHALGPQSDRLQARCPALATVLTAPALSKCVIDVRSDLASLRKIGLPVTDSSFIDLQMHPRARVLVEGTKRPGTALLARELLGIDLPKDASVTRSKWGRWPLTDIMVQYAAQDAVLALVLGDECMGNAQHVPLTFEQPPQQQPPQQQWRHHQPAPSPSGTAAAASSRSLLDDYSPAYDQADTAAPRPHSHVPPLMDERKQARGRGVPVDPCSLRI